MSIPSTPSVRPTAKRASTRLPAASAATWVVGSASVVLLAVAISGYVYHRRQLGTIAAKHLRLVVTGPAELQCGAPASYEITATTVTGESAASQIETDLYSSDRKLSNRQKEMRVDNGRLTLNFPGSLPLPCEANSQVQLNVVATHDEKREEATIPLPVHPVRYWTRLSLDKACYRPGETVYYRSLSLSRFGLAADRELAVRFEIVDSSGVVLTGSSSEGRTEGGVGQGAFLLPKDLPDGRYWLVAHSLEGVFPEQRREFQTRGSHSNRFKVELKFSRESYDPGDTVTATLAIQRQDSGAKGAFSVKMIASVDGQTVFQRMAQAAASPLPIEFALPAKMERGEGLLTVELEEANTRETLSRVIPIHLGKLDVRFFPEGGELVEGVESRVYFSARDPLGRAVTLRGTILDSQGRDIGRVETTRPGLGSFSIQPRKGETYGLKIASPAGIAEKQALPPLSAESKIVMSAGTGVFEAGAPLEFSLRSAKAGMPLMAAAWCRGVLVGQRMLVTEKADKEAAGLHTIAIPLEEQASGVLRLIIYDYTTSPPKIVAERLVYRRPARQLMVRVADLAEHYAPGETVAISLATTNEKDEATPATLGVAVVAEAALDAEGEREDDLETVGFHLSGDKEAALAYDLLLGTRNLRGTSGKPSEPPKSAGTVAMDEAFVAPAVFDNLGDLRAKYEESLTEYRAKQTRVLIALVTMSFFGGLGLTLFVTMLALLNVLAGIRIWAPLTGAAVCCFVAGAVLMDAGRAGKVEGVAVPYAPFSLENAKGANAGQAEPRAQKPPAPALSTPGKDTPGKDAPAPEKRPLSKNVPSDLGRRDDSFSPRPYVYRREAGVETRRASNPEVLYWQPKLVAGPDGRAAIRFDLPDSQGKFIVLVEAHHEGRIGSARAAIISRSAGKAASKEK